MSHPPIGVPRSRPHPTTLAGVLAVSILGASCATQSGRTGAASESSTNASTPAPSASRLQKRIDKEARHPVASARAAAPPAGVTPDQVRVLDGEALTLAQTPTDEAIAAMAALLPDPRQPAPRMISQADADEALRAYITGRAARLAGDLDIALADLERSARLNPNPAEPWREMAETHLARGDRHSAERDFRRAFDRNPTDPAVLERTALLPVDGSPSDAIAGALARLYAFDPAELDPAMRYLVPAGLGRVLLDRGYAAAGAELLAVGADLPSTFGTTTFFRDALSELYRRRGELYRDAGDALMRLDQPAQALEMYDRGSDLPLFDPDAMLAHRVAALMRMGRPAAAASIVLFSIEDRDGQIRQLHVDLFESIADASDTGPAIIESLRDQESRATPESVRATHSARVRAIAALLPPEESRAFLRREVVAQGADEAIILDLYHRLDPADPAATVREAILLTELDPLSVDRFVDALRTTQSTLAGLLDQAQSVPLTGSATVADARALVNARLLSLVGRYGEALAALAPIAATDELRCAAQLHRIAALRALADFASAEAEINALDTAACPGAAVGKATLLAESGRGNDALELLSDAETNPDLSDLERSRISLIAARILISERRFLEAERRFRQVLILDPTNESAYAGLITLFAQGGALPNERELLAVVRDLRDNAPESRTFRTLRARDLITRNRLDLAERELVEIVERYPDDAGAITLLLRIWNDQDRADEAEAWLRGRLARMPGSRVDRIELARLLVDSERAHEAALLLEQWLALSPADQAVSITLESVYREALGDDAYANQLARHRLERSPVTIDTLGETALLDLRAGDSADAVAAVSRMLDLSIQTSRPIGAWGNRIAGEIGSLLNSDAIDPARARAILDDLALRAPDLSEPALLARVQLLGQCDVPVQEMIDAAELTSLRHPRARDRAFYMLLESLRTGRVRTPPVPPPVEIDAPGVVRRPLDAPDGNERDEFDAARDRMSLAFDVVDHIKDTRKTPIDPATSALILDLGLVVVQNDNLDDLPYLAAAVDDMLDRPDRDDVLAAWIRMSIDFGRPGALTPVTREQRADAADLFSSVMHNAGDDLRADRLGRLALEFEPNHATAANNLGYRFLERDENIAEATELIERAYAQEPDAPNVIDSMAWARYKNGIMHDEFDADGEFIRAGAVSLLRQAVKLVETQHNQVIEFFFMRPVLMEHLGDAEWAAGYKDEAIENWRSSLRFIDDMRTPKRRRQFSTTPASAFKELYDAGDRMRIKLDAVDAGEEPPIARIHGPINPPPPPGAPGAGSAPHDPDTIPDDPPLGDEPPGTP